MRWLLLLVFVFACESKPASPLPTTPININQATIEELEKLPGIGPKHAKSIMASRNARGGELHNFDELLQIDGIGQGTIDKIRPYIVFGPPKH